MARSSSRIRASSVLRKPPLSCAKGMTPLAVRLCVIKAAPAAGLLTAYGSLPLRTQIYADLQLPDLTQIPASSGLRRTEAEPCNPKAFLSWNGVWMLLGARRPLLHGKISV